MSENLHDLLQQEDPTALPQIERALASREELTPDQEAVLTALVWRRCTSGPAGLLGCVIHGDCAGRLDDLPDHLERIGAEDAAGAVRELREAIPLEDDQIKGGLADWIDTQPEVITKAQALDRRLGEIDQSIWDFMRDPRTDIPDLEFTSRAGSVLASIMGFFRAGKDGTA